MRELLYSLHPWAGCEVEIHEDRQGRYDGIPLHLRRFDFESVVGSLLKARTGGRATRPEQHECARRVATRSGARLTVRLCARRPLTRFARDVHICHVALAAAWRQRLTAANSRSGRSVTI
jgi:hypothetical protein